MLILCRPLALHRRPPCTSTRAFRTRPRRIPSFISAWTPSAFSRIPPQNAPRKPIALDRDEPARRAQRRRLRESSTTLIEIHTIQGKSKRRLSKLNGCLKRALHDGCDSKLRRLIWRHYSFLRDLPLSIPSDAWDVLWSTQAVVSKDNPLRTHHLLQLHTDMQAAGVKTTMPQRIAYLWGTFKAGRQEQAIQEWEADHSQGGLDEPRMDHKRGHLQIGAMMYADFGDADRAREIMEELLELYPETRPYALKNVFRAHTRLDSEHHHTLAYEMYLTAKSQYGDKMWSLRDFDQFLVGFLEARHISYAIAVFKHMVEKRHLAVLPTTHQINQTLARLHKIYRLANNVRESTTIVLAALSVLSLDYQSYIYGNWIKYAAVYRAPEAAARILDRMIERGFKPETYHFNLLLKVMFRSKIGFHETRAEDLAWRMIDKQKNALLEIKVPPENRTADTNLQRSALPRDTKPLMDSQALPPANAITFALLMRFHASKSQWEHVEYLTRQLGDSAIQPNTDVMNIMMDNKTRQGKFNEAGDIYKVLTNANEGVFPDGLTMRILWTTLRLSLGNHEARENSTLPTPREMLSETLKWNDCIKSRYDAERFRIGLAGSSLGAVTKLVLHCFSYTKDLAGSLVALHVLNKCLRLRMSGDVALLIQKQAAWTDLQGAPGLVRTHFAHGGAYTRNIQQMGMVYNLLMEQRYARMNIDGNRFAYMDKDEKRKLELNLLSEFVRVVLKRQYGPDVVEGMIDEAKAEIGVVNLRTGDMTAYEVA